MSITTKIGDGGGTQLYGGRRISKDHPLVEAIGHVDELNALLGWAASGQKDAPGLKAIQEDLFVLGADLATPRGRLKTARITPEHVRRLEGDIRRLETRLPPLRNFILPGGGRLGAPLHTARAVCRRAERAVVKLMRNKTASLDAQIYLNRLSDLLFLMARDANRRARRAEIPWRSRN